MSDTKTAVLSSNEREYGLRAYLRHLEFNGIGINFLNVPIISLLAVTFGATNVELGYISSVFQFAGILLVILPRLLANSRMVDVFYYAWLLRGFVCLLYAAVLILDGQPAVILIMAVFTVFALLRIVAVPMTQPLQKSIMRPAEMGQTVVRLNLRVSISQLIAQFTSFLLLSLPILSGAAGLVLLTYLGIGANTMAARQIRKIPSRERVEYHRGKTIFTILVQSMKNRERALTLFARWLGLATMILFQFGVPFLRRSVGMPANMVFLYTVFGAAAAIVAGLFLKPFADSIGSKPLLIITYGFLTLCALAWAFADPAADWVFYFILGFATFFFLRLWLMLTSRLVIKSIPEDSKINYTAMMNFVAAISAIAVGLVGGWLADIGGSLSLPLLNGFGLTYLLAALIAASGMLLCFGLKDPGSLSLRETAAVFLSTKNLRALLDVHQLDATSSPVKRETILHSLENSDSDIATDELRLRLRSPLSWEKERILRSLYSHPREELLPQILEEARDEESYNRLDAIFALGAYPLPEVRSLLERLLDEPRPEVKSTALKSLARVDGDTDYAGLIHGLLSERELDASVELDYITALARTDKSMTFLSDIFSLAARKQSRRFRQMVYVVCTRPLNLSPPISEFFQKENIRRCSGFSDLLDELSQLRTFYRSRRELRLSYERSDFEALWAWCRRQLEESPDVPPADRQGLVHAILTHPVDGVGPDDAIAALYLTFQMLNQAPA